MKDPGAQHNGACIRVNIPDHSKDKMPQDLRRATEIFLKKVIAAKTIPQKNMNGREGA